MRPSLNYWSVSANAINLSALNQLVQIWFLVQWARTPLISVLWISKFRYIWRQISALNQQAKRWYTRTFHFSQKPWKIKLLGCFKRNVANVPLCFADKRRWCKRINVWPLCNLKTTSHTRQSLGQSHISHPRQSSGQSHISHARQSYTSAASVMHVSHACQSFTPVMHVSHPRKSCKSVIESVMHVSHPRRSCK